MKLCNGSPESKAKLLLRWVYSFGGPRLGKAFPQGPPLFADGGGEGLAGPSHPRMRTRSLKHFYLIWGSVPCLAYFFRVPIFTQSGWCRFSNRDTFKTWTPREESGFSCWVPASASLRQCAQDLMVQTPPFLLALHLTLPLTGVGCRQAV